MASLARPTFWLIYYRKHTNYPVPVFQPRAIPNRRDFDHYSITKLEAILIPYLL